MIFLMWGPRVPTVILKAWKRNLQNCLIPPCNTVQAAYLDSYVSIEEEAQLFLFATMICLLAKSIHPIPTNSYSLLNYLRRTLDP